MSCVPFLITYPNDYQWLPFLWRSIDKHVTGLDRLVMVLEDGDATPANLPGYVEVKRCRRFSGIGRNMGQPVEKLAAGERIDADAVFYVDSDCVFVAPVDLRTYSHPLLCRQWENAGDAYKAFYDSTHQVLGFRPPFETMCRFPFVYPTDFVREAMAYIGGREKLAKLFAAGLSHVCEFNVLGNYAIVKRPERFHIVRADLEPEPPKVIRQFWSHGGLTPAVLDEIERLGLR